jgi:hypothetical protein
VFFIHTAGLDAQKPFWIDAAWRNENYPKSSFLQGFVQDSRHGTETVGQVTERLKEMARADVSKSVISTIQSTVENYSQSIIQNGKEQLKEHFGAYSKSESKIEISGINIEAWVDENSNMAYAFAYANKFEVIGYYKAAIQMEIQKMNAIIDKAKTLEAESEKLKALANYESAIPLFANIAFSQGLLIAVDSKSASYKAEEIKDLQKTITEALIRLSNAVAVFIDCSEDIFGVLSNDIQNQIKAALSQKNFNFVDTPDNSDWKIVVKAKAREYNKANSIHYAFVDAEVSLIKTKTNTKIYQEKFSEKGGHVISYGEAAKKAVKDLGEKIALQVLGKIE